MELLLIILAFLTIPLIIYQSIVISNKNEAIEHKNRLINTYLRELNKKE